MNVASKLTQSVTLVDCDVHPTIDIPTLIPYLSKPVAEKVKEIGTFRNAVTFVTGPVYPRMHEGALRRDAAPSENARPGSDPQFALDHHIIPNNIGDAALFPVMGMQGSLDREIAVAFCRATNEWLSDRWLDLDERFRGTILVPMEHPDAAAEEIRHWRDDKRFIQIGIPARAASLLGNPYYWPVYEAAVEGDFALGIHPHSGDVISPLTSGGWSSFYFDEMMHFPIAYQSQLTSMIANGLFEHLPDLRVAFIEGGFGWGPTVAWRLDKIWKRQNIELPQPSKRPSEYIRKHCWFASQPMEEYRTTAEIAEVVDFLGWDRLVFSSDYPHWDNDDVNYINLPLSDSVRRDGFFRNNAKNLYGNRL